jgi:hypothetical protein
MRALALILCLAWGQAWAVDYYAAPGGGAAASCVDATTNVCTLSRAVTVAGNGDTISLAAGTYAGTQLGASGYVLMTSELINLTCAGTRTCILQPSTSTAAIRLNTPPNGGTIAITGVVVDGLNGTAPNYCFWFGDSAAGTYTATITESTCMNPVFYGTYVAATGLTLTMTNVNMTATSAVTTRSYLFTDRTVKWAGGAITISGGTSEIANQNTPTYGTIEISANAAGLTASVSDFTGTTTLNSALTSTGEHPGIELLNVASSTIRNSTMNVIGNVGSRSTALFRINSCGNVAGQGCVGTETPRAITTAVIDNVTGTNGTPGGYGAIIGQDATSSADNQITGAHISDADITCTVASNSGHGAMLGYLVGGRITRSKVDACGINFIAKKTATTASEFSGNLSINAGSQHFRLKGALALFANNTAASYTGTGSLYYADVESVSGTNSTVSLYNNIGYANGGVPAYNVFVETASTLTVADDNDWYGAATWYDDATTFTTLATWNAVAAVGTDLDANPAFAGGASPTLASGFRLSADSSLRRVGTDRNAGNYQDNGNRGFLHPPSIGAWEAASGDQAAARTAR